MNKFLLRLISVDVALSTFNRGRYVLTILITHKVSYNKPGEMKEEHNAFSNIFEYGIDLLSKTWYSLKLLNWLLF